VSLWDSKSKEWVDGILPRKTYILSSLIQEFAGKVKRTGEGISVVSMQLCWYAPQLALIDQTNHL